MPSAFGVVRRDRRRTLLALAAAGLSAALWGWATRSMIVAAVTLITAAVAAVAVRAERNGNAWEPLLRPFWIGAVWTAVDVLWGRFGIGAWGRW